MKNLELWQKIVIGLVLGIIVGFAVQSVNKVSLIYSDKITDQAISAVAAVTKTTPEEALQLLQQAPVLDTGLVDDDDIAARREQLAALKPSVTLIAKLERDAATTVKEGLAEAGVYVEVRNWAANLKWIGDIFINLIMMVIVPLVLFSIISGIISLGDPKMLGRMGAKAIVGYVFTTMVAICIAFVVANVMQPGNGVPEEMTASLNLDAASSSAAEMQRPSLSSIVLGIVPKNAVQSMAERQILQVIFFAVFVGVAIVLLGEDKTRTISDIVHESATIFYKIVEIIIETAPIAVFALTAWVIGVLGIEAVVALLNLVLAVTTASAVQYGVILLAILVLGRLNPVPFIKKAFEFQLLAFTTSSSSATIPTTMKVCETKLGVSKTSSAMIVPLGATVNMNGTAIYISVCTVFVAQLVGVHLTMEDYVTILTTVTLLAMGTAAIPSASLIMMPVVFGAVGLPVEAIALILGVDRFLDMLRTSLNVTGDAAVATIIDRSEKRLNEKMYYQTMKTVAGKTV